MLRAALCLSVALHAAATAVTPLEKVTQLLEGLIADVKAEGKTEAELYDKFACFCKDTSTSKSDSIIAGRDNINSLSAEIADKTATKEEKQAELKQRQADHEAMTMELAETEANFAKEKAEYEATAADLSKAISSLESAIKAMEDSKPASLLQVQKSLKESLAFAEVLGLVSDSRRKAIRSFLQVDPSDPTYEYHSGGIIETLENLNKEFVEEKRTLDADWAETKKTYEDSIASLNKKLDENSKAMDQLEEGIERLKGEIAEARESLVNAEGVLKDDQLYLTDVTVRCEVRAKDWDQRSHMRADELAALTKALEILSSEVAGRDKDVNNRAMLLQRAAVAKPAASVAEEAAPSGAAKLVNVSEHGGALFFFQESGASQGQLRGTLSMRARQIKVAVFFDQEGKRLGSVVLSQLALSLQADPFAKVKTLIQQLVERLLAEATAEATKKGFCDEQLARASKDRDSRLADTQKLDVETQGLEIKLIEFETEIEELTGAIAELNENLKKATEDREAEHEENLKTMKTAKAGEAAVANAIFTLKVFYKQAAKAESFLQASPVDEDTAGAGFDAAYKGKQESSEGIIGLLEVIKTDFDHTYKTTEASEKAAHEEFVEFDRVSRSDIGGKETKKSLDEQDAQTTTNKIASNMADLMTNQDLLDDALKKVEDLKPTCIDTGMSYEERVAKREEEIEALKKALCMLDAEGVELECAGENFF